MEEQITSPHDKFFKRIFSSVTEVRVFLKHFLRSDILDGLRLETLEHRGGESFVDKKMKEFFTDMVYVCEHTNGQTLKISILFEHKSYWDAKLPVQLLTYLTEGYKSQTKDKNAVHINYILPILLYHGPKNRKQQELKDMVKNPVALFERYLPNSACEVIDLNVIADSIIMSITESVVLSKTLTVFKYSSDKSYILQNSREILSFTQRNLSSYEKRELIVKFVRYIFAAHRFDEQEINQFTENLDVMGQAVVGSYADVLLEKGMEKGKIKESTLKSIKSLCYSLKFLSGFPEEKIAKVTSSTLKMTVTLRKLLEKNNVKSAEKAILKNYFKDVELDEKERKELLKSIRDYYASA